MDRLRELRELREPAVWQQLAMGIRQLWNGEPAWPTAGWTDPRQKCQIGLCTSLKVHNLLCEVVAVYLRTVL